MFNNYDFLWKVFEVLGEFLTDDFYITNFCNKESSSKLVNCIVVEIFSEIFTSKNYNENLKLKKDLLKEETLDKLYNFLNLV